MLSTRSWKGELLIGTARDRALRGLGMSYMYRIRLKQDHCRQSTTIRRIKCWTCSSYNVSRAFVARLDPDPKHVLNPGNKAPKPYSSFPTSLSHSPTMSSGFVSSGTTDAPIERDDEWLKAQHEIEANRRREEEESRHEGGKTLYDVLQGNKGDYH